MLLATVASNTDRATRGIGAGGSGWASDQRNILMKYGAVFFQVIGVLVIIEATVTVRTVVAGLSGTVEAVVMITQSLAIIEGATGARGN